MKGTSIRLHVTFLLLLFLCVVLHEFGHIFAARHFGVRTREALDLLQAGLPAIAISAPDGRLTGLTTAESLLEQGSRPCPVCAL